MDRLREEAAERLRPGRPRWGDPMLATLHHGPLPPGQWLLERKFDGQRVAAVSDEQVRLVSRSGIDVTLRYPDLIADLPTDRVYVLDGEIVAFVDGKDDFAALQRRMHAREPDLTVPVYLLAFDLLHLDGEDLGGLPLGDRRMILQSLGLKGRSAVVPATQGAPEPLLERACAAGWEGLIAKRVDSTYQRGRSREWLKLKCLTTGSFLIGGYTAPQGARVGFGALLVGERMPNGRLRYAGKVGTGFRKADLRALHGALERLRMDANPFIDAPARPAAWVAPVLVCEIGYTERTRGGRLRHPRFKGLLMPNRVEATPA